MTYQVMALKWRPQTFEEVVGQEPVTKTLQNAIKSGRIGHAYLFTGPRGVGKTTVARILAKAVNCKDGPTPTPCNQCTSCQEIANSTNMDVLEIDGASNRKIDDVRELREKVRYAPVSSKYKVIIIDEIHMFTPEAFNALLKTLEEPPEHVIFIFATTQPQKIPPTILSRCQSFDFRRIPTKQIVDRLSYILDQEKIQVDNNALVLIAKKAEGSLRDGQSLLDQVISYGGEKISEEDVSQALGLANRDLFFQLVEAGVARNSREGLELAAAVEEQGWDVEEFVDGLLDHLRLLLLAKTAPESPELKDFSAADGRRYSEQGAKLEDEDLLRMIAVVSETETTLRYSSRPKFLLEMMVVKLSKMDATVHLKDLMQSLNHLLTGETTARPLVELPQEEPAAQPMPSPQKPEGENLDLWDQMLDRVQEKKTSLGAILRHGQLGQLEDQSLTIVFPKSCNFHREQAQKRINREVIEEQASSILGKNVRVRFTLADLPEPAEKPQLSQEPQRRKLTTEEVIKTEPILGTILETLDGEMVQ